jgi:prepilin-type N-terminal cleavage/methylation domain-containing protein
MKKNQQGFTLIELLVVISIIGFITVSSVVVFNNARMKARDAERIANISQIVKALDLYYDKYNTWPDPTADACVEGWDDGYCQADGSDKFISALETEGFLSKTPGDPLFSGSQSFKYYVYEEGSEGCSSAKGKFYVLGIPDLETDTNPPEKYSGSGFSCPARDWQEEFDYVVGGFEIN